MDSPEELGNIPGHRLTPNQPGRKPKSSNKRVLSPQNSNEWEPEHDEWKEIDLEDEIDDQEEN